MSEKAGNAGNGASRPEGVPPWFDMDGKELKKGAMRESIGVLRFNTSKVTLVIECPSKPTDLWKIGWDRRAQGKVHRGEVNLSTHEVFEAFGLLPECDKADRMIYKHYGEELRRERKFVRRGRYLAFPDITKDTMCKGVSIYVSDETREAIKGLVKKCPGRLSA